MRLNKLNKRIEVRGLYGKHVVRSFLDCNISKSDDMIYEVSEGEIDSYSKVTSQILISDIYTRIS